MPDFLRQFGETLLLESSSANFTLKEEHHGKTLIISTAGKTITVPVGLHLGFVCHIIPLTNVSIVGGSGVTVNKSSDSLNFATSYSPVQLFSYGANTYIANQFAPFDVYTDIVAATIDDGDTTHAPSGDAVFDALALQGLPVGTTRYDAVLTQASTAAPVATVGNKTISGTLTWARTSAGLYTLTSNSTPFTADKTQIFIGATGNDTPPTISVFQTKRTSTSVITLYTSELDVSGPTLTAADGMLVETAISIIVLP